MADLQLGDLFDIEDLALELGTDVTYPDGSKSTPARIRKDRQRKADMPARPPVVSVAQPQPAPQQNNDTVEMLKQVIALLNRPVEVKLPDMPAPQVSVAAPAISPSAPVKWAFEFDRNPNGTIKQIHATPKLN